MMPVKHTRFVFRHITVLADAGSRLWSGSTGMSASNMTAVDLTATCVIVNKHFLKVTYSPFNDLKIKNIP